MSRLIFDIEADGLLDTVSQVWCIVTLDIDTQEMLSYTPETLSDGLQALERADLLVGHNIIGYDIPALTKALRPFKRHPKVLDTLVASRFLQPERWGGHSLEAWGERLKAPKGDFSDFSEFSDEMLEYCKQDVRVNYEIFKALEKENGEKLSGFQVYDSTRT